MIEVFDSIKQELYDAMEGLKEMLFDAPTEIKQDFNTLVNYFEDKKTQIYTVFVVHRDSEDDNAIRKFETKYQKANSAKEAKDIISEKLKDRKILKIQAFGEPKNASDSSRMSKAKEEFEKFRADGES